MGLSWLKQRTSGFEKRRTRLSSRCIPFQTTRKRFNHDLVAVAAPPQGLELFRVQHLARNSHIATLVAFQLVSIVESCLGITYCMFGATRSEGASRHPLGQVNHRG